MRIQNTEQKKKNTLSEVAASTKRLQGNLYGRSYTHKIPFLAVKKKNK